MNIDMNAIKSYAEWHKRAKGKAGSKAVRRMLRRSIRAYVRSARLEAHKGQASQGLESGVLKTRTEWNSYLLSATKGNILGGIV